MVITSTFQKYANYCNGKNNNCQLINNKSGKTEIYKTIKFYTSYLTKERKNALNVLVGGQILESARGPRQGKDGPGFHPVGLSSSSRRKIIMGKFF